MDKIVISEDKNKFLMDGKTVHFTKEDLAVIQEAARNTEDDISIPSEESNLTEAQVKQRAVDEIVSEMTEEREGMLMLPEDVKTDKRVRGYSAAWLLGVLTGAVSVGMLVLSSFLLK